MRLPNWTEEELILTLELYFRIKRGEAKHHHSEFKKMSEKLKSLNIYPEFNQNPIFRNTNGISRKLGNFSAIDPDYEGRGLYACSIMDKEVFMKFYKKTAELRKAVADIEKKYLDKTKGKKKQLPWTEEELILALALYKVLPYGRMHGTNPKVIALSKILNKLPIYDEGIRPENFRSIASVSLRLSNYRSCDPECNTKGLHSSGTGLFKEIFSRYYRKDELLADAVTEIEQKYRVSIRDITSQQKNIRDKKEQIGNLQSSNFYQLHKSKEIDSSFYQKVKKYHYAKSRICSVCRISLDEVYGKLGEDMLEYHCVKEFSTDNGLSDVCIGDYIQVCAVCHKLLDKYYGLIVFDDLKNVIANTSKES